MKTLFQNIKDNYKLLVAILFIGLFLGWMIKPTTGSADMKKHNGHEHAEEASTTWTCSMHPQIKQNKPGLCPICAMDLIPLSTNKMSENADLNEITISEVAMKLADIQTSIVKTGQAVKSTFLQGKIVADERNISKLTARFGGRIEQLYVNFTGQKVKKGEPLASIYSPELINTQRELIEALSYKESNPSIYKASIAKLQAWDLSDEQIAQIEAAKEPIISFDILSPISGTVTMRHISQGDYIKEGVTLFQILDLNHVWLMLDAYESDLPWLKVGNKVSFTLQAIPGQTFEASIDFIDPVINENTRTVGLRAVIDNQKGMLKPGMFVSAYIESKLMRDQPSILIPKSAVLWTGKRAVVYVKVKDRDTPTFLFREIKLGPETGENYIVDEGLSEGEEIATNGVFKIDAAAQLEGKSSMMNNIKGDKDIINKVIESFQVAGNCGMCKETIEGAAMDVNGVISAKWDKHTKTAVINFDKSQTTLEDIHKAIARSGYDTKLEKAKQSTYDNLHSCCKYDRNDFGTPAEEMKISSFKVYGNCGMCKERIEEAALSVNDVHKANWNKDTKMIEINFESDLDLLMVHKAIAAAGHDTDKEKAPEEVYNNLPGCCLYDRP